MYVSQLLMDVARHKNSVPLPLIKPFTGPKLPPDRYCLTAPNYRLRSQKKVCMLSEIIAGCVTFLQYNYYIIHKYVQF